MKAAPPTAIAELQQWPRWVVWRTVERDGKPTKVPFQPSGRPASSTDPGTWGTHTEASSVAARGHYEGVGYVFAADDEYAGVDLDKCVTDGKVDPAAWKIVERLNSYTELSPTGTGLHVIVRGRINGDRKRTAKTPWGGDFESYDQDRFFTVTGQHRFGTPATIEARQEELDEVRAELFPAGGQRVPLARDSNGTPPLDDVELLERIRKSKQGPKFADLFDRGAPENQESEADLGLCNILAFWLGPDPARIDSWFRRSALMRGKWDDRRGETTYGGYTIDRALEKRTEFYTPRTARARPKDDDVETTPGEEITHICGLIDDLFVSGWRSSRQATCRVVLVTQEGRRLDLANWKAATSSPPVLAQEVALQLGVEVVLKKEDITRLNVLVGKFCKLAESMTTDHRARQLGERFLAEAQTLRLDWSDQAERRRRFEELKSTYPAAKAKVDGTSISAASKVLEDVVTGKRYVVIQWFVDYVKAAVVSSMAAAVLEAIEQPEWWSRPNSQSRFKAAGADGEKPIYMVMFEVPSGWGADPW